MAEYSKILRGNFTSKGANKFLSLPMVPDTIEIWNETQYGTTTNHKAISAIGFAESAAGTAYATASNGTANLGVVLASGGFTFLSAGTYAFGPTQAMATTFVTQANPANVTVTAHGYKTGDTVWIYGTTGMLQIAGAPYVVTVVDANNFTIDVNSSGFASAATAGFVKKFNFPDLYIPEGCIITAVGTGTTTTITTSINHNFVVGQEVFFVLPNTSTYAWGMNQLDSATVLQQTGIPQQAYVTSIPATNQIVVNVNSTGFTAFSYPTSAQAALGMTFPQVLAIGDQNTGYTLSSSATPPFLGVSNGIIGIPGSFAANTRQGVIIGTGDGTTVLHVTSDVVAWRAVFPDAVLLNQ